MAADDIAVEGVAALCLVLHAESRAVRAVGTSGQLVTEGAALVQRDGYRSLFCELGALPVRRSRWT